MKPPAFLRACLLAGLLHCLLDQTTIQQRTPQSLVINAGRAPGAVGAAEPEVAPGPLLRPGPPHGPPLSGRSVLTSGGGRPCHAAGGAAGLPRRAAHLFGASQPHSPPPQGGSQLPASPAHPARSRTSASASALALNAAPRDSILSGPVAASTLESLFERPSPGIFSSARAPTQAPLLPLSAHRLSPGISAVHWRVSVLLALPTLERVDHCSARCPNNLHASPAPPSSSICAPVCSFIHGAEFSLPARQNESPFPAASSWPALGARHVPRAP